MPLVVKPISANLTHDTETFQRMDPYVKMFLGSQQKRSQMCKDGGKHPYWNDTFFFNQVNPGDTMLRVQIWDDDTVSDDMVGEGTYNISQLFNMPSMRTENQWVDLYYQGRPAGRLQISIELQNAGNMGNFNQNQGAFNQGGFNQGGFNQGGFNQGGFNQGGFNQGGFGQQPPNNGGWGQQPSNNGGWGQQPPNNGW